MGAWPQPDEIGREIGDGVYIRFEFVVPCDGDCSIVSPHDTDRVVVVAGTEPAGLTPVGLHENHRKADGSWCGGWVGFANVDGHDDHAKHTLDSYEPLTVSPSLLCRCGFHGFIREGRWVAA